MIEDEKKLEEELEEEIKEEEKAPKETEEEAAEKEEAPKKGGRRSAKDKKAKKELEKKDEQIADLTDRLQRSQAEFDNFRKRTDKEKTARFDDGAMSVIEKVLLVVDDFERGLAQVPEEDKSDPFVDGMDKIYKHLLTCLEELGVKPIEAVGAEFDPEYHNAVMHEESEEDGTNIVKEEFQKGYMYKDTVLRHSMVKVVN